jgi:hypothetical protein
MPASRSNPVLLWLVAMADLPYCRLFSIPLVRRKDRQNLGIWKFLMQIMVLQFPNA